MTQLHLEVEGLFRVPGSAESIAKLKKHFEKYYTIPDDEDPHAVCGLVKSFLRELPNPVVPPSIDAQVSNIVEQKLDCMRLSPDARACVLIRKDPAMITQLKHLFLSLPPESRGLIKSLARLCADIACYQNENKMNAEVSETTIRTRTIRSGVKQ